MTFYFSDPYSVTTQSADDEQYQQYANENYNYRMAVNAIYKVAAYYLLAGQQENAVSLLNKYFPTDKATEYMLGIQNDLHRFSCPVMKPFGNSAQHSRALDWWDPSTHVLGRAMVATDALPRQS